MIYVVIQKKDTKDCQECHSHSNWNLYYYKDLDFAKGILIVQNLKTTLVMNFGQLMTVMRLGK